jgi:hypothetical protein
MTFSPLWCAELVWRAGLKCKDKQNILENRPNPEADLDIT